MHSTRWAVVLLVLTVGVLGALWAAWAQDARPPWPAPPVPVTKGSKIEPGPTSVLPTPSRTETKKEITPPPPQPVLPKVDNLPPPIPAKISELPAPAPAPSPPPIELPKETGDIKPTSAQASSVSPPPMPPKALEVVTAPAPPATDKDTLAPPLPLPPVEKNQELKPEPKEPKEIVLPPAPNLIPVVELPKKVQTFHLEPSKATPNVIVAPSQKAPAPVVDPVKQEIELLPVPRPVPPKGPVAAEISPKGPPRPPSFRLVNPIRRPEPDDRSQAPPVLHPGYGHQSGPLETATVAGAQAAQLILEKRGPGNARVGQPIAYLVLLRNPGPAPAVQVRIEDEIPAGVTVLAADPPARRIGQRLVWTLDSIPAGGEKQLRVELQAQRPGELVSETQAQATLSSTTRTTVGGTAGHAATAKGLLHLAVAGPGAVRLGQTVKFDVQVINRGKEKLTGLMLQANLPPGLKHALGSSIEAPVGDLEPGVKRSFTVPTTAAQPGRHVIQVWLRAANGQEVEGQGEVLVVAEGVRLEQAPATRLLLQRDGELSLQVTNHEARPLHNVTVTNQLPEGIEFVQASERGIYRQEGRSVYWLLDYLQPGQTQTLLLKVQGVKKGQFTTEASVRAQDLPVIRSTASVEVDGLTDLAMRIVDRDDPLEVGKETVYEIRVVNQGSGVATNVQLLLTLTGGLTPRHAQGPTSFTIHGQEVRFAAAAMLPPGAEVVYHVSARADTPGDRRLRAQLLCDQMRQPLTKEERTMVYNPSRGMTNANPPGVAQH